MLKLTIFAAIALTAALASAQAGTLASKGRYENDMNQLRDASLLNRSIEACSHDGIKPDVQTSLAKLMNVSESTVRYEFCRRVLTAYASGAIPYDDYRQFAENHLMAPSISKALRMPGASSLKPQSRSDIVLPIAAKMNTGEIFKGNSIASQNGGHFSVRSSLHATKCSGRYDPKDRRPTITLSVECSDGRKGQVEVTRAPDLMSGWGKVKLSDGSTGRVTIGTVGKQS